MTNVLVIDDDRSVLKIVSAGLNDHQGIRVVEAADGDIGLSLLEEVKPEVALLDIFLPKFHGLELFRKIRALDSKLPVIFITGDTSSETAIEAMRAGAFDYLSKPLNIEQLRSLTVSAVQARALMDQPVALPVQEGEVPGERFVGRSKRMIEVYKDIGRVSSQNVTVLIRGESGCGKELVARALVNHSDRRDKPFVAVNCASIPDQLLESELFGHEKGAFTGAERRRIGRFEQCDGGTIFLDEVGDMSPATQGKVLRLLQEQRFERVGGNELISTDVRVITATNRPLEKMVADGDFREDLLYRLNAFSIVLPPLRERRDDIPLLIEYFLHRATSEMDRPHLEGISPQALEHLVRYDWPGNVRQLQSVVRQSVLQTTGTVIGPDNLPSFVRLRTNPTQPSETTANDPAVTESQTGSQQNTATMQTPAQTMGGSESEQGESVEAASFGSHHLSDTLVATESSQAAARVGDPAVSCQSTSSTAADQALTSALTSSSQGSTAPTHSAPAFDLLAFIDERLQNGSTDLYAESLEQMERHLFQTVLQATGGNQSKTAEILGITRGKVRDRIATFGIQLNRTVSVVK